VIRHLLTVLLAALVGSSASLYGAPAFADQVRAKQWHLQYLKVDEAHQISTGKGITVAVIDTGVAKHPDLSGSILSGFDFLEPGGNGQSDSDSHGTGMAGLIAAHGSGQNGALGIAPDAKILPIRVLSSGPASAKSGDAVNWAIGHGASVINLSVGGSLSPAMLDALDAAVKADIVVVASAGNKPHSFGIAAPAFVPSVVAVTAIGQGGSLDPISATGPEADIAAPGAEIESTSLKSGYSITKGTSDSSAIVAGAAALIRSKYPELTAPEVVDVLESTADDKGAPGVDSEYGHGVLNIVAALKAAGTKGGASAPASPTTTTAPAPLPSATPAAADPGTEPASNSGPLIIGVVLGLLALMGGLATFLAIRRRSQPQQR
jgi:type VII secretion-associated serine protease mycosin